MAMAQVLRSIFGSRRNRGNVRSLRRMARSRARARRMRAFGRSAGRSMVRSAPRRAMRAGSRSSYRFTGPWRHRRGAGFGRVGLLASIGALILGSIFGGRQYMNRPKHRIGSRDVSHSKERTNVPPADY